MRLRESNFSATASWQGEQELQLKTGANQVNFREPEGARQPYL